MTLCHFLSSVFHCAASIFSPMPYYLCYSSFRVFLFSSVILISALHNFNHYLLLISLLFFFIILRYNQSVQFSCSVVSDSLRPHELQHARPPCPSPTPGVHSDSRPSSQRCHPAISSSVVPFSSCPQSLPASESFPMSQLFAWGGQSNGVSALASFLPKKSQGWSPSRKYSRKYIHSKNKCYKFYIK